MKYFFFKYYLVFFNTSAVNDLNLILKVVPSRAGVSVLNQQVTVQPNTTSNYHVIFRPAPRNFKFQLRPAPSTTSRRRRRRDVVQFGSKRQHH